MLSVALLTGALIAVAGARVYERCELARELQRLGVSRDQVATWVCIAFHESRFDTAARNPHSGDHGLLQISELYWCGPGKACGLPCSALRDEDIADDVRCALRIYKEHTQLQGDGFMAWVVYPHYCRSNAKKYLVDCDRSVKSYSEKFDENPRRSKTDFLNFTVPQVLDTSYDNRPPPSYLSINSLFQGNYFEEFERDYYNSNKQPFNWINFKIDNIDDLKLPATNRKGRVQFTTDATATTFTTTTTTASTSRPTTTLEPSLRGIKPPSPRRIESNQFRRRKMKLEQATYKTERLNNDPTTTSTMRTTSLSTTTTTPNIYNVPSQQNTFNYYSSFTRASQMTTTSPRTLNEESSTHDLHNLLPLTTTVKPTTATTLRTTSEINSKKPNYRVIQRSTTVRPTTTSLLTTSRRSDSFRGFRFYSSPAISATTPKQVTTWYIPEGNKGRRTEVTTKEPTYSFSYSSFNRVPSVTNETLNTIQSVSLNNSSKFSERNWSKVSPTPQSTINISGKATTTNNIVKIIPNTLNKTLPSSPTWQAFTRQSSVTKPQPPSRGKSHYSEPITQSPIFSSPSSRTAAPQTTKLSSVTSKRSSTQSIFDLYLNPTRRPTIQPFSFTPFNRNPNRVRIFSDGTTPSPSIKSKDSKSL